MAFIKVLKDNNQNTVYPQTLTEAVVDTEGNSLDTIHASFITATGLEEDIENVNSQYESTSNKVSEISAGSTNSQYPSAKATYNAIISHIPDLTEYVKEGQLPTKTSELQKDDVYTKDQVDSAIAEVDSNLAQYAKRSELGVYARTQDLAEVATTNNYNVLDNKPFEVLTSAIQLTDGSNVSLPIGNYVCSSLYLNGTNNSIFTNSCIRIYNTSSNETIIAVLAGANYSARRHLYYRLVYRDNVWVEESSKIDYSTVDLVAGQSELTSGTIYFVYE